MKFWTMMKKKRAEGTHWLIKYVFKERAVHRTA